MGCSEVSEWIEEQIEKPVETSVGQWAEACWEQDCNWWCICCNKWFCVVVWVVTVVVTWIIITVGKWVVRVVCDFVSILFELISFIVTIVLDVIGFVIALILSIPIVGGFIRTILNWLTEIIWRIIGLPDFFLSLLGIRLRKKMYLGAVVPTVDGESIATDALIMRQVDAMVALYDSAANIGVIFTGICHSEVAAPDSALDPGCDAGGFFNDWWLAGSYFETATALCKFPRSFRRIIGLGAELIAFAARDVTPAPTRGCSFGSTHNYVMVEFGEEHPDFILSHEVGHSCWLPHVSDAANLMFTTSPTSNPQLTNAQIAVVRWSKHCVFF